MNIVGDPENFKQPYDHDDEYVSKSALKRESTAAQELGERLLKLSKSQLDKIQLDEELLDAIALLKKIKVNTDSYRRQVQFIGRLMRNQDLDALKATLDQVLNKANLITAQDQITERLRDKLLAEGDAAIQELLDEHPALERQKLRQLVRQTNKELAKGPESKSNKELFQYLRTQVK